jgi:cytoskeletal protein CcmA (bactofilin family)
MSSEKIGSVDTILGAGSDFKGQIIAKGTIRIDGRVEGNVSSEEGIIIGEKGTVKGNVSAKTVLITGKVNGNVNAAKRLEIMPVGQLQGDIRTPRLAIAEGVIFKGNCDMGFEKFEPELKFDPNRPRK